MSEGQLNVKDELFGSKNISIYTVCKSYTHKKTIKKICNLTRVILYCRLLCRMRIYFYFQPGSDGYKSKVKNLRSFQGNRTAADFELFL